MINHKIREELKYQVECDAILFESPSFDDAIIGYTDQGNVVYSFDKMVECFASENCCDELEAIEFIEYNTIRSLPYIEQSVRPIVVYALNL